MVKDKMEDIPTLEEPEKEVSENIESGIKKLSKETKQEEDKLQIVTNDQLIQFRLDNLTIQVQEITSQLGELIKVLTKEK